MGNMKRVSVLRSALHSNMWNMDGVQQHLQFLQQENSILIQRLKEKDKEIKALKATVDKLKKKIDERPDLRVLTRNLENWDGIESPDTMKTRKRKAKEAFSEVERFLPASIKSATVCVLLSYLLLFVLNPIASLHL